MSLIKSVLLSFLFIFSSVYSPCQSDRLLTDNPVKLNEYVTDETGTLSPNELSTLRLKLRKFYDSTSTQVVVLLINSLNGEPIENAANSIYHFNGIGGKEKNNGVLLLISKGERKIRLEVGYGLEGALTDAMSMHIIQKEITPELKKGNYYKGIENAVTAIISLTNGEYTKSDKSGGSQVLLIIIVILIPAIVIIAIFVSVLISKKRLGGSSGTTRNRGFYSSGSQDNYSSYSSDSSSSSDSDSSFSGGGGDSGGGGASGDY